MTIETYDGILILGDDATIRDSRFSTSSQDGDNGIGLRGNGAVADGNYIGEAAGETAISISGTRNSATNNVINCAPEDTTLEPAYLNQI